MVAMEGTMTFDEWFDETICRTGNHIAVARSIRTKEYMCLAWTAAILREGVVGVPCRWTEDMNGQWESECGASWEFNEGGPVENEVKYCHGCGKRVEVVAYVEEVADDDDS